MIHGAGIGLSCMATCLVPYSCQMCQRLAAQQHVLWPPSLRIKLLGSLPGAILLPNVPKAGGPAACPVATSRRLRLPLNPSRRPWRPSRMSCGHLPGAFLDVFFWLLKATLGTRPALKPSRRLRLPLAAQPHVLWPPAGRFPGHFLLASESDVRHEAGLKTLPAP